MAVNVICSDTEWGAPSYAGRGSQAERDSYYDGQYTSITAWEAALPSTFIENETAEVIGLMPDTNLVYFNGINTTESYKIVLKAAAGQNADGTDNAGARTTAGFSLYEQTNTLNIDIQGLEFSGDGSSAIFSSSMGNANSVCNITKCVFRDKNSDAINFSVNAAITVNIGVCLFRNLGGEAVQMGKAGPVMTVINCTVYDTGYGIYDGAFDFAAVVNNVSMENSANDFTASAQSYNCSSDTSASGTGSMTSKIYTDQWTDPVNNDFTVKNTSADIYHAGIAISGEPWFPSTDLVGTAWGSSPSIGCFEFADSGQLLINDTPSHTNIVASSMACLDHAWGTCWPWITSVAGLVIGGADQATTIDKSVLSITSASIISGNDFGGTVDQPALVPAIITPITCVETGSLTEVATLVDASVIPISAMIGNALIDTGQLTQSGAVILHAVGAATAHDAVSITSVPATILVSSEYAAGIENSVLVDVLGNPIAAVDAVDVVDASELAQCLGLPIQSAEILALTDPATTTPVLAVILTAPTATDHEINAIYGTPVIVPILSGRPVIKIKP